MVLRECGFTLDGVGAATMQDGRVGLPEYSPFYDRKQDLFLRSCGRRRLVKQKYAWDDAVRDQGEVLKNNVALISRRGREAIRLGTLPLPLTERYHDTLNHVRQAGSSLTHVPALQAIGGQRSLSAPARWEPDAPAPGEEDKDEAELNARTTEHCEWRKSAMDVNVITRRENDKPTDGAATAVPTGTNSTMRSETPGNRTGLFPAHMMKGQAFSPAFRRTMVKRLHRGAKQ